MLEPTVVEPAAAPAPTPEAHIRLASLFPGEGAPPRTPWWRHRLVAPVAAIVAVLLVASVLTATGALGSTGPSYRTATVGTRSIEATITGVATIEPVSQASVAFPVTGTVAGIDVAVGDAVAVGQQLATLDTDQLTATLHEKEQALADAQLTLTRALNGESTSGASGSGSARNAVEPASTGTGTSNPVQLTAARMPIGTTGSSGAGIAAAQQAVLQAQQQVDAAMHQAQADMKTAATVCEAAGVTSTSASGPGAGATGATGTAGDLGACQAAIATVLTDQQAVSGAQRALATAADQLDTLLDQQAAAGASPGGTGASGSGGAGGAGSATGSASNRSAATPAPSAPSAQQLVAYQKAVDAAAAEVAVAQQAVAQATIVSPIAGTVVAVDLTQGGSVTAGSSTENVVIKGAGGYEVTTNVSIDRIAGVKLGQQALLTPDGSTKELTGKVTSIASLPTDSTSSTPTYRVVVGLDDPGAPLNNGSTGSLAIVTGHTIAARAVPTSAITTTGSRHTVQVVEGGSATTVTVRVGVVGETWTEVTDGLRDGQQVVLADLGTPLPSAATSSTNGSRNQFPAFGTNGFARFGAGGGPQISFGGR